MSRDSDAGDGQGNPPHAYDRNKLMDAENRSDSSTLRDAEEDDSDHQVNGNGTSPMATSHHFVNGSGSSIVPQFDGSPQILRHGFEDDEAAYTMLANVYYLYFTDKRHKNGAKPKDPRDRLQDWRMRDRQKTVMAALMLCLNIGVDPPDAFKTDPCAKLECWVDPSVMSTQAKALEQIARNLQAQYEGLSLRTRYKVHTDPSVEDTKKICTNLRRSVKEERLLFHYNGHGVPKPTASGEIWVFNKTFTQYIPVSLYDLQSWLGSPCMFVYDCSNAGNILINFNKFAETRDEEMKNVVEAEGHHRPNLRSDCIQLAACGPTETLPLNPNLPADLFTSCLTTPMDIALRWFVLTNPLPIDLDIDKDLKVEGKIGERKSPLGELQWIFTAITDTIAWTSFPPDVFKRLFRQDLMVAALFRNYLLAERVMRTYNCTPMTHPPLPETHNHHLWASWDLAVDMCVSQLPAYRESKRPGGKPYEWQYSQFFTEQLRAFEVWLERRGPAHKSPEQLPIVLQVLLSQSHRLRALVLLSKFLDLGSWAVNLALSIGIFPYVLKLLSSPAPELKPVLIFIWARILAVDQSCQNDLLKDNGYLYFVSILQPNLPIHISNMAEQRAMCAFVLSIISRNCPPGQIACLKSDVITLCLGHLADNDPLLRQWASLCIGQMWNNYNEAKETGLALGVHEKLLMLLGDFVPEVRAAALYSLTTLMGHTDRTEQICKLESYIALTVLMCTADGSVMVRNEAVCLLGEFAAQNEGKLMLAAYDLLEDVGRDEQTRRTDPTTSVYTVVWKALLNLSVDPYPDVAQKAAKAVDHINTLLLQSPLADAADSVLWRMPPPQSPRPFSALGLNGVPERPVSSHGSVDHRSTTSLVTDTIKRSASIALSLKNMALNPSRGSSSPPTPGSTSIRLPEETNGSAAPLRPTWNRSNTAGSAAGVLLRSSQRSASGASLTEAKGSVLEDKWRVVSDTASTGSSGDSFTLTGSEVREKRKLSVPSTLFDFSAEYFTEPQMQQTDEADEPGSLMYNERQWRKDRNEGIISTSQGFKDVAARSSWDEHIGYINNETTPRQLLFHQFEPHFVCSDDKDMLTVWNHEKGSRLNRFSNANPQGTRITAIDFINEDDLALLISGTSEGVVRVYRNYESHRDVQLVTSFRALSDILPTNQSSGLVMEWQQTRGTLLCSGDVKAIRVWDMPRELCIADIPARSGSNVTSLTSDQVAGNVIVAGFGDGAVRVYDRRHASRDSLVQTYKEHNAWIQNVHMQRGGFRELVSGSVNGQVKLWDVRNAKSIQTIEAHSASLEAMAVHEHAPVIATGSSNQFLKVWNSNDAKNLSVFRFNTGLFNKIAPITALTFHPHYMILAGAAADGHINFYRGMKPKKGVQPMPHIVEAYTPF